MPLSLAVDHHGRYMWPGTTVADVWYSREPMSRARRRICVSELRGTQQTVASPGRFLPMRRLDDLPSARKTACGSPRWATIMMLDHLAARTQRPGVDTLRISLPASASIRPSMHLASDGFATWPGPTRAAECCMSTLPAGETSEPLRPVAKGVSIPNARNPSIIAVDKQILVAFESLYDQIEYALLENGKWRGVYVSPRLDERLKTPTCCTRPQLALDRHGVVWLFFSDTTRRFTYFARWLGSEWSDYLRLPRHLLSLAAVRIRPVAGRLAGRGKVSAGRGRRDRPGLGQQPGSRKKRVPSHCRAGSQRGRRLQHAVLGFAGSGQMQNLRLGLDEAQKGSAQPAAQPGKPGSFDQDRVLNHGTVLFDEGKFRMWYGGASAAGRLLVAWMSTGYAESHDGLPGKSPALTGRGGAATRLQSTAAPLAVRRVQGCRRQEPRQRTRPCSSIGISCN